MPRKAAPTKKTATRKPATKGSARKTSSKRPAKAPAKAPVVKKKVAKKAAAPAKAAKPAKRSAAKSAPRAPVQKTRVVLAKDYYEAHKDEVKAPIKAASLKWNFLGEGKGLYKREGLHVFTQFLDDGVHYSVWGDDKEGVQGLLDGWRKLLGEDLYAKALRSGEKAVVAEKKEEESEALKLWRLQEPQRRPGEPDLFFEKRVAEWNAKKPA